MPSKLLTTSIAAPGFYGLNTQDSVVSLEAGYATVATNCVIDKFGRIGARKGWSPQHSVNAALALNSVTFIGELIAADGTAYVIVAGNNKLFKLNGSTLVELTYGGGGVAPTITGGNWQAAPLNGVLYLYQEGHTPLAFVPGVSTTTYRRVSEIAGALGTPSNNKCVISAYGRTWSANNTTSKSLIQFSDLLAGQVMTTGTAGTLDVTEIWPAGADEIIALAAHNGLLIVFGRRQILLYGNAQDPAALSLQDTITGVGCFARDSVVPTGSDVFFLSDSGVKSLSRVIQERSAPMRDISANVRDDLVGAMSLENADSIKAIHSDKEGFYLITFPTTGVVYCFDLRMTLPNGASRATVWDGSIPTALFYRQNKDLLLGKPGYVGKYDGYKDNVDSYQMRYYTNYFDFGAPTAMKIMKKVGVTTIGGQGYPVVLRFGYDYTDILSSRQFSLANAAIAEYNISEYNVGEYGGGAFDNKVINVGGSGKVIQLGFETTVNNRPISIQKIDVFTKVGKTV
jgi:hypothetical protein